MSRYRTFKRGQQVLRIQIDYVKRRVGWGTHPRRKGRGIR